MSSFEKQQLAQKKRNSVVVERIFSGKGDNLFGKFQKNMGINNERRKILNFENLNYNNATNLQFYQTEIAQQQSVPLVQFNGNCSQVGFAQSPNMMQYQNGLPPHLAEKTYMAQLDVLKANAKTEFEYICKSDLEHQKSIYAEKREETREKHRRERELAQLRIFENADGKLCMEQKYPDGTYKMSQPILPICKIRLKKSCCPVIPENDYYKIVWNGNPDGVKIPVSDMTVEKMAQAFQRAGVVLSVSRTKKSEVWEAIFGFLFENVDEIENLAYFGWNKTKNGWVFNWKL